MALKEASEKRLRAELAKNAAKQQELGDAWDIIEKSLNVARELDAERNFIVNAAGLNSTFFTTARNMVRAAYNPRIGRRAWQGGRRAGRGGGPWRRPGGRRRPRRRRRCARRASTSPREKINLTESLAFMQRYLGADAAIVKRILEDKTPEARATELIDKCRLMDSEI